MKPDFLLPEELLPATVDLIQRELLPGAAPTQRRVLLRVARFLVRAHRVLKARLKLPPPSLYVGLLPPRDSGELYAWGRGICWQRERCGLTRRQLARRSGVAPGTIHRIESGRYLPSRAVVMQLQAVPALGLPSPPDDDLIPPPRPLALRSGLADCSCWFAPKQEAAQRIRELRRRFNGVGGNIEQAFLYTDQASAKAWRAVTAQADYPQRLLPLAELARETAALLGRRPVDLIGLGAGEAKEEVRLVQALLTGGTGEDLRLFLLDLSQPLLSAGYRHAAKALAARPHVGVFAIQGDFRHLPSYTSLLQPTTRRRVLCMFGDTFCSLENELLFMRQSLGNLAPGDLFVVDVPLAVTPTDQLIEVLQANPWAPLPQNLPALLRRLHEFLVGPFRRYVRDFQRVALSRTVDVTAGLVPGSYAVDFRAHVQTASGAEREFCVGGLSKRYDPTGLRGCLRRQGWEQVKGWHYANERHPRLLSIFQKIDRTA